jgi:hypothetical protein
MLVMFNVDPMAGTGVAVGPDTVGPGVGDVPLLLDVVQPAIATAAKIANTNKMLPDLNFITYRPDARTNACIKTGHCASENLNIKGGYNYLNLIINLIFLDTATVHTFARRDTEKS